MPKYSASADRALLVVVLFVLALVVVWYLFADHLYHSRLFAPEPMTDGTLRTPDDNGGWLLPVREHENLYINSGDGYVHARLYHDNPGSNFVLFCHGNSGTIGDRGYIVELTQILQLNLIVFDYRGFGESKGTMNEKTILEDAEAVYHHLVQYDVDSDQIIIWGESLGGSPAVHVARRFPCLKLVLMFAFASLRDVAIYADMPDYLRSSITPLLLSVRKNLPNKTWMRDVEVPVLIIHSVEDAIVNIQNAKILYDAIPHNRKTILYIRGAHSAPKIEYEAFRVMSVFLRARVTKPYLATHTQIDKMDRVLTYYNYEINEKDGERHRHKTHHRGNHRGRRTPRTALEISKQHF